MLKTLEDILDDRNVTALELAVELQRMLRTSPRTFNDSEFLGHLTMWIKHHPDASKPITTDH